MEKGKLVPDVYKRAICYSGFRDGQSPGFRYPSYEQILEDLLLLQGHWNYLRLYDCDLHSERVLEVIKKEQLDFKVMLGAYITAERNNHACPWGGGVYSEEALQMHHKFNETRIHKLISMANQYPGIINALSTGNEACVDWTDHYVPMERIISFVEKVKKETNQPVSYAENYVPWLNKLKPLGEVVDFISIHTYPVWEYKNIHEALDYTKANYKMVADTYPDKNTIITEAGWATNSNGRGINPDNVSQALQKVYFNDLMQWTDQEEILCYFFEAFDEPWKGSAEPLEPEKHWGLFNKDRQPKEVIQSLMRQK